MSTPADTISLSTRLMLAKHGLKDGDYGTKELIGSNARGNCLLGGECDAVPLGQPEDIVLAHKGFRKLGDSLDVLPVQQFNVLAARRAWAAAHKATMARLARAYGAAFSFLREHGNRNEIADLIAETTGAPADVAREILALYYEPDRGVMPKRAEINMAGMAKVIEMLAETGQIGAPLPPAERFVDLQYLQAAGLQ
jgi:ABC-type nitrate/sulfonate/bicarbonate transport system substrate-binding protein